MTMINLNSEQREAVLADGSQVIVAAGAGSGKTRVIVQRYLRLIDQGFSPEEIVAVTFTKRAAVDLKRRIVHALRESGRKSESRKAETGPIQTIHSFYERLLRENALWAGVSPEFEILPDYEIGLLITTAIREALTHPEASLDSIQAYCRFRSGTDAWKRLELEAALIEDVSHVIAQAKNAGWTHQQLAAIADPAELERAWSTRFQTNWPETPDTFGEKLHPGNLASATKFDRELELLLGLVKLSALAWEIAHKRMEATDNFDFHFLETAACGLIESNPQLGERMRNRYRAVLLDEAQDSNLSQFRFFECLNPEFSLMVGDSQQAIYGFRGGDRETFERVANGAISLATNYRSIPGILNFVNKLFSKEWKHLYFSMKPGQPADTEDCSGVEIVEYKRGNGATTVVHKIKGLQEQGVALGSIAVIVAQATDATKVTHQLAAQGIRYQNFNNSQSLFNHMEARDMANLLEACVNPREDYWLACVLRSPYVNLSLDGLVELGQIPGIYKQLLDFRFTVHNDREKVDQFLDWFEEIREYCDRFSAHEIINRALNHSPYLTNVAIQVAGDQSVANARKLLTIATTLPHLSPIQLAERFRRLQSLGDRTELGQLYEPDEDAVQIMTIHKSKGLEFENVILFGESMTISNRNQPYIFDFKREIVMSKFLGDNAAYDAARKLGRKVEESERWRQLYVALTRAEKRLIILHAPKRLGGKRSIADLAVDSILPELNGITISKLER